MLKHNTAYRITEHNVAILHNISGIATKTLQVNIGWYAAYSETRMPRWCVAPKSVLETDLKNYNVEEDAWNYSEIRE